MDLWVVNDTIHRSRIGAFSGPSSARGAMFFGAFWRLGRATSKGQGRLRG